MNTADAICSAMPCAASGTVPSQPIITEAAANSPTSARLVSPIGQPSRNTCASASRSTRQNRRNRSWPGKARTAQAISAAIEAACTTSEAMAAPRMPSSGKPQAPKIRAWLPSAFSATAPSVTHSTARVRSSAAR